jgi:hypothetical protein
MYDGVQACDIDVQIIEGFPAAFAALNNIIAYGTIESFTGPPIYVWKEVNFTVYPPYIKDGGLYTIILSPQTPGADYYWEITGDEYHGGNAYQNDGLMWVPLDMEDFIFATYMDTVD